MSESHTSKDPPSARFLCLGCGHAFSQFGRTSHMAQTQNAPCREIAAQEHITQASSSYKTASSDRDIFGTYEEDEMSWPSNLPRCRRTTQLDADDKEDESMDSVDGHHSYIVDSQDTDEDEDDKDNPDDEEKVVHEEGGTDVSEGLNHVTIETFPSQFGDAGAAMERGSGSLYRKYNDNHQEDSEDNIYAPFQSKLDWDFAQWAKLCGPGSTAINKLLNIDGVSIL